MTQHCTHSRCSISKFSKGLQSDSMAQSVHELTSEWFNAEYAQAGKSVCIPVPELYL